MQKNQHFVRDILQFWQFRHVIKQVGMSQSATPATQNDMTTCLETFEKERFCGFPHRHGEATRKPETRDVSCEASVNFQHIAQNATLATEFAPCRHLTQPCQCDLQKTRNTTRRKCCACHGKWRWTRPKCCACHENCNTSSENVAKVLRLPRKTTFDTLQNTSECHEVPRLPRETKQRHIGNLQKWPPLQNFP